jgi:ATP-dependent protease ClpP protease subunit
VKQDVRRIDIHGAIDRRGPVNVESVRRQLRLDDARIPDRVHLSIDSCGGDVAEAERIFSLLRALPCSVEAIVGARCESAAIDILLAADLRICRPCSRFLLHASAATMLDSDVRLTADRLEARAASLRRADAHIADILFLRTGHDRQWFVEGMSQDRELDAPEAVHCSLVHGIVGGIVPHLEWLAELASIRQRPDYIGLPSHLQRQTFLAACAIAPLSVSEAAD